MIALHFAAKNKSAVCIRQLVSAGANPAIVTKNTGRSALHMAAQLGSLECIRVSSTDISFWQHISSLIFLSVVVTLVYQY